MKVIKRDGRIVDYDGIKIVQAVGKALKETTGNVNNELCYLVEQEVKKTLLAGNYPLTVEGIQDSVENTLMSIGNCNEVAKNYILYRAKRNEERNKGWKMTELQKDIYLNKYKYENESFDEFINRVSGGNSDVAKIIRNQDFSFGGRILAGRGLNRNVTMSNCYVLPQPDDNIESIFDVAKMMARTYSYGGGVGTDLSLLRPEGAKVNNAALTTSGPVSFMDLYDVTTAVIGQKGRRGALMLSMSTEHPDIDKFIKAKSDTDKINHANISVRSSGEFFKLDTPEKRETLRLIAENNWATGEPGMLFWDRVEDWHLLSNHPMYKLYSTNPCGEQPLPPFGNCLLGSINLSNFIKDPFTKNAYIDYTRLEEVIRISIIGLNEVLHEGIPLHPLKEQRETANNFRQIGLGIMGLSDMFIKLGVKYGSDSSIELSDELGKFIRNISIEESIDLVDKYGLYPEYDFDYIKDSSYFKSLPEYLQEGIKTKGMANSHVLSIAPTGSISTMFGVSGGIEPIFANSFTRTTKSLATEGDVEYKVYTEVIQELMDIKGLSKESELPDYCITSHDIDPQDRISVQAVWQKYIDSAISSTINLKENTTVKDIENIYIQSYASGLKGVTVFRDNCFRTGILNTKKPVEDDKFKCPECGHELNMAEGCNSCPECGWGQCSI